MDILISYIKNQKQRLNNRGRIKSFATVRQINENISVEGTWVKGIFPISDRVSSSYIVEFFDSNGCYVNLEFDTVKNEYEQKKSVRALNECI